MIFTEKFEKLKVFQNGNKNGKLIQSDKREINKVSKQIRVFNVLDSYRP